MRLARRSRAALMVLATVTTIATDSEVSAIDATASQPTNPDRALPKTIYQDEAKRLGSIEHAAALLDRFDAVASSLSRIPRTSRLLQRRSAVIYQRASDPYENGYIDEQKTVFSLASPSHTKQLTTKFGRTNAIAIRVAGAEAVRAKVRSTAPIRIYTADDVGKVFGPFDISDTPSWVGIGFTDTYYLLAFESDNPDWIALQTAQVEITAVQVFDDRFVTAKRMRRQTLHERAMPEISTSFCSNNASCVVNATCYTNQDFPAMAIARTAEAMIESSAGQCSGSLIADTAPTSMIPYFLTANHCLSTQAVADSLVFFWDYFAPCSSLTCDSAATQVSFGATLLATGAAPGYPDFSLLRLWSSPPIGGFGRSYLGFSTELRPAVGDTFFRVSHPRGAPEAFSTTLLEPIIGSGCAAVPSPNFWYENLATGGIEPGSSGSVVVSADGLVLGQLNGLCGTDPTNACSGANQVIDGVFSLSYPYLSQWLNPPDDRIFSEDFGA